MLKTSVHAARGWALLLAAAPLCDCYAGHGEGPTLTATRLGDPHDGLDSGPVCGETGPGPAPMRRLTRAEYNNTVRDLLGDRSRPADRFVGQDIIHGFDNNADTTTSRLLTEQYEAAANGVAARATADLPSLLRCDPVQDDEDACVREFVIDFGRRAFRRPLLAHEIQRYHEFFASQRATEDLARALELTLSAMLQSPKFLYRVEHGTPSQARNGAVPLTSYEMASRLSYLLWNTMPDEALFDAAARDELTTPQQLGAQAERMLADPRAREVVLDFHEQWLALRGRLPTELLPMEPLLRRETQTFLTGVVLDGDGTLETLLRADFSYMNAELASFYGLDTEGLGDAFEPVALDPTQRSGVLTQALTLAINAREHETSPIARGRLVRELLLCQPLPPAPPTLMVEPPQPDPHRTTRERYAQHGQDPACSGCHELIDPLGFAFEHYDHRGQWRDQENGLPIDASGQLSYTDEVEIRGEFDGAVQLADKLATSETVEQCMVQGWFRYAYGRDLSDADQCTLDHLSEEFRRSDGNIRELLITLTQTDAFRFRPVID